MSTAFFVYAKKIKASGQGVYVKDECFTYSVNNIRNYLFHKYLSHKHAKTHLLSFNRKCVTFVHLL